MKPDVELFRQKVIEKIDMTREPGDSELHEIIDTVIENNSDYRYMSINERGKVHKEIYDSIKGLGILEELIENQEITEIMINGTDCIYIEKSGRLEKIKEKFTSDVRLNDVIQQMVGDANKRVNESNPIVDTRLADGSRVNVVLPPVAIDGAVVTIRKFPQKNITMEQLIKWGSVTREVADFLRDIVVAGYNIFISGGTGSGKTTFLNALSDFIPRDERIITIEDSAELQLSKVDNLVRLEARQANSEGNNEVTIRDLIKTSLRMRPNRIIVGEVRGKEALDMLQAMNTGHDGSMSTGHANSPQDMLARLETMVLMGIEMPLNAIRAQIASGIDVIVHLGRLRDKSRRVLEIDEVVEYIDGQIVLRPLYIFRQENKSQNAVEGKLIRTEYSLLHTEKIESHGIKKEEKRNA